MPQVVLKQCSRAAFVHIFALKSNVRGVRVLEARCLAPPRLGLAFYTKAPSQAASLRLNALLPPLMRNVL
jgi:hypothetical protein